MAFRFMPPVAAFLFLALSFAPFLTPLVHAQTDAPLYLALGDSLAFGVGADSPQDDGFVTLTAEALRQTDRFAETGLDVENLGSPGAKTADLFQADGQIERAVSEIGARQNDAIDGNEVAIISISIGANDLLALAEAGAPCVENAGSEGCRTALTDTLTTVQSNLIETLRDLREAAPAAEIYVTNLYNPYSGSGEDFEIIASVGVQQLNGVISVATSIDEFSSRLVPIFELFQGRANQWIAQDGTHPNNDGYRVMAEAMMAAIEQRPAVIPEDLLALPTESPVQVVGDGSGIDPLVFWIALPVVFVAGVALSSAYFVMRRG